MHKISKIIWVALYMLRCLFCMKLPSGLVAMAPQLLIIGFRKISFSGFCIIFPMSRIEVFGRGRIFIGKNVQIGQYCHMTCAESIVIGDGVAIAGNVVITDISHGVGPIDVPPLERAWKVRGVIIESNCFIGYGAVILPGTHLSKGCVVGANAKVSGNYPPGSIIV